MMNRMTSEIQYKTGIYLKVRIYQQTRIVNQRIDLLQSYPCISRFLFSSCLRRQSSHFIKNSTSVLLSPSCCLLCLLRVREVCFVTLAAFTSVKEQNTVSDQSENIDILLYERLRAVFHPRYGGPVF